MSVSAIVPQMIHLELDAGELVFEPEDFDYIMGTAERTKTGVVATKKRALLATVSGNVPYTLLISAPEEYFFGQRGGLIHISQLRWRLPPDSGRGSVERDNPGAQAGDERSSRCGGSNL